MEKLYKKSRSEDGALIHPQRMNRKTEEHIRAFSVEFTNHCNYRCVLCPHAYYKKEQSPAGNIFNRKKEFISRELCELALDEAGKHTDNVLIGFFGKPLLHPRFRELMACIPVQSYYEVHLNTNWSLFEKKHVETFRRLHSVRISLDTNDPDLYDTLCSGGHVLTWEGQKNSERLPVIEEKLKQWLGLQHRPKTRIVVVKSTYNRNDLNGFVRKWQPFLKAGDQILLKSVISYGGVVLDDEMSLNRCDTHGNPWVNISWEGTVSPCNLDVNMELGTGNLLEEKSINNITSGTLWASTLKKIKNKQEICIHCFDGNNWSKNESFYGA